MPDQQTIDYMMSLYKAAEPFEFDDPIMHTADSKLSINDEKRYDATVAKKWLMDVGVLQEDA